MTKSDKSSHLSIDFTTTRAQKTRLNIHLSLNIYLQDVEHVYKDGLFKVHRVSLVSFKFLRICTYRKDAQKGKGRGGVT